MARGSLAKDKIIESLKIIFPNSFMNGKEFRIPVEEEGEVVEIKVALTCAKDNVRDYSTKAHSYFEPLQKDQAVEKIEELGLTPEEKKLIKSLLSGIDV